MGFLEEFRESRVEALGLRVFRFCFSVVACGVRDADRGLAGAAGNAQAPGTQSARRRGPPTWFRV